MSDLVAELHKLADDAIAWDGDTMKRWDQIRRQIETMPGADLPRMNFEDLIEDFSDKLNEAAAEIECLRLTVEQLQSLDGRQQRKIERLRAALRACADDLEASVNAEYHGTLDYPSQKRKWERDLEPVKRARELLGSADQQTADDGYDVEMARQHGPDFNRER